MAPSHTESLWSERHNLNLIHWSKAKETWFLSPVLLFLAV